MKPVYMCEDAELQRDRLSVACRPLYQRGWFPGTFGSVSIRSGEAVMITADGLSKGMMSRQDMVIVDPFEGLPLVGETEWPPAETPIHLAIYRRLPDCGAVVHANAPHSIALAELADGTGHLGQVTFRELGMAKGLGVPDSRLVVLPAVEDRLDACRIADDVMTVLDESAAGAPLALLIERSGIFTWGCDTDEAGSKLECAEELSRLLLLTGAGEPGVAKADAQ